MTDTPSSILLTREQSTGSNTNLWGGYLITTERTMERSAKGYQALAVTGDATISWTNYSATNDGAVANLKLTGSLTATATLTFPANMNDLKIWNTAGASVTIKCSGGTGVTIPNSRKAIIACDGTDYYFNGPNYLGDDITETNNRDIVDYLALSTAIAASVPAGTAGTIFNSALDTTRGYLATKLLVTSASGELAIATENGAGNEDSRLTFIPDEGQRALYAGVMSL